MATSLIFSKTVFVPHEAAFHDAPIFHGIIIGSLEGRETRAVASAETNRADGL